MADDVYQDARPGEALDLEALQRFIDDARPSVGTIQKVRQFKSGYSNLTYLIEGGGRSVVLRRPPFGPRAAKAHDMVREYRVLEGLAELGAALPQNKAAVGALPQNPPLVSLAPLPLALCENEEVLGAPFYLMSLVDGTIIRAATGGQLSAEELEIASGALVEALAALHRLPIAGASLAGLGSATGYVERQVEGWIKRFERARTSDVGELGFVAEFLRKHTPADHAGCLVHNDYKFDNVIFSPGVFTKVACILDWEMCTIGHPLMDLGLTLAYWAHPEEVVEMPFLGMNSTHLPGCPRRPVLVEQYFAAVGSTVERGDMLYYYVFGNVKIAGIVQQIYARYVAGHTQDQRFAQLGVVVDYLLLRARRAIESGSIG